MKNIILVTILFIILSVLVIFLPTSNDYIKTSHLYINEILSSNNKYLDNFNNYSDYIEIYNNYNYDIDLNDYYISDSEFDLKKWKFPNITIKSKEYLVIYASELDTCDLVSKICHTNFKLSNQGEVLTLSDSHGNIISKVKYPEQDMNISYSYHKNKYILTSNPTPGYKNEIVKYKESSKEYNIKITEYMTHNNRSHYDKYGNYYDWIEIYNNGNAEVSLKGLYISDNENNITKSSLPDVTIKPNEYKIIYLTKEFMKYDGLYVNLGLSDSDKKILISTQKEIIDSVDVVKLKDDISYGIKDNKWQYFLTPTPGYENITASFERIGDV